MQSMQVALLAHPPTTDRVTALVVVTALALALPVAVDVAFILIAAMLMEVNREGWEVSRRPLVADLMWWTQA